MAGSALVAVLLCGPPAEVRAQLVFSDNFDGSELASHWVATTEGWQVVDGRLSASANGQVLTSVPTFTGELRLEFDVEKVGATNHSGWDFAAGFQQLSGPHRTVLGVLRFDHDGVDAVSAGNDTGAIGEGQNVDSFAGSGVNAGHVVVTYQAPLVTVRFQNLAGQVLQSSSTVNPIPAPHRLWINIAGHADSPRLIDNLRVYNSVVPEPSSAGLAVGMTAVGVLFRRRRAAA